MTKQDLAQLYEQEHDIINKLMGNAPQSVPDVGFSLLDWAVAQPEALSIAETIKAAEQAGKL